MPLRAHKALALLAAVLLFGAGHARAGTISGRVRYEDRAVLRTGLGTSTFASCRFNDVEVLLSDGSVLGQGILDASGNYSVTIADQGSQSIFVRVYARRLSGDFRILVLNNTLQQAIHTARTSNRTVNTNLASTIDVDITIASTAAGAFNIFDQAVKAQQSLRSLTGQTPPQLSFFWETGSSDGTFFRPSDNSIHLLGQTSDPDEFDDDVILHETGHYMQANFSRDDTPAGAHAQSDSHQDLRVAWSEGSAYWWAGFLQNNAEQRDFTAAGVSFFEMETPSNAGTGTGADTETAVEAVLWDIQDDANTPDSSAGSDDDGFQLADAGQRIFDVVRNQFTAGRDTTLENFYGGWFRQFGQGFLKSQLDAVLRGRQIDFNRPNLFENGTALSIPDAGAVVESTISVPISVSLTGVRVFLDVAHTAPEDLVIDVVHPDGTSVRLHNRTDTPPRRDIFNWVEPFDKPLPSGSDLGVFNSKNGGGTWRLRLQDAASGTQGQLRRWRLSLLGNVVSPNLTVASVGGPASSSPGSSIPVTSRVENSGAADATSNFTCAYVLSTDSTLSTADVVLGTFSVNGLDAGDGIDDSRNLTVPAATPLGSYFLGLVADTTGTVAEASENDNTRAAPGQLTLVNPNSPPDLAVASVTAPAAGELGQQIAVSARIENRGSTGVSTSFVNRYFLSTDRTITSADTLLASFTLGSLGPGDATDDSRNVTIPSSLAPASYFVGVLADAGGQVTESDEGNNGLAAPSVTTVSPPASPADLIARRVVGPRTASLGATVIVTVIYENAGGSPVSQIFSSGIFLSDDFDVDDTDLQLATFSTDGLPASQQVQREIAAAVPAALSPGTRFLGLVLDLDDQVLEASEANNSISDAGGVLVQPPPNEPDLTVISAITVATASVGDRLPVTATVENGGGTDVASAFTVRLLLTRTRTPIVPAFTGTDVVVASLAAGEQQQVSASLTLPLTLAAGDYFVAAVADAGGNVQESVETNNSLASANPVAVAQPILSDLVAESLAIPSSGFLGGRVSVTPRIRNAGNGASGEFQGEFLLSGSQTDLSTAVSLGNLTFPTLSPGAMRQEAVQVSIPSRVAAGPYHFVLRLDPADALRETDETNNSLVTTATIRLSTPVLPDLAVVSVDGPTSVEVGASASVRRVIRNLGNASVQGAFSEAVVLSTTSTISAGALRVATFGNTGLAAGGSSDQTRAFTVPAALATGSWFVGIVADPDGALPEIDEENNALASVAPTSVTSSRKPDLVLVSVSAPASILASQPFNLTRTVRNDSAFGTVAGFSETVFLSSDAIITTGDLPVATFIGPSLAPGASNTTTRSILLPSGTPPGSFFVGMILASGIAGSELTTANNSGATSGAVTVVSAGNLPDIVPASLTNPSAGTAGSTIVVERRLENRGRGSVLVSFEEVYLLSASETLTATAPRLATFTSGALASGGVDVASREILLPTTLPPGTYTLGILVDPRGQVVEATREGSAAEAEANNLLASSLRIAVGLPGGGQPDLGFEQISTPLEAQRGAAASVTAVVVNGGTARAGQFSVRFFLSVDQRVDAGTDTVLGTLSSAPLDVGGRTTLQGFLPIPSNQPVGNYFILAQLDPGGDVVESDETNNLIASPQIAVSSTLTMPDLLADTLSFAPTRVETGEALTLTWAIRNTGGSPAQPFRIRFFLSTDTLLGPPDAVLASLELPTLPAGAQPLTDSTTTTVPATVLDGAYFVGMVVDDDDRVREADERNNQRLASSTLSVGGVIAGPDLEPLPPTVATSATIGTALALRLQVRNPGPVSILGQFTSRALLSADGLPDTSDVVLAQFDSVGLAAGAITTFERSLTVPRVTPGSYQVLLQTDVNGNVSEDSELNNVASSPILIRGAPDLRVEAVVAPTQPVGAGVAFPVRFTLANRGNAAARGPILNRILLSSDAAADATDLLLRPVIFPGDLSAGAQSTLDTTAAVPEFVVPGDYRLLVVADATNTVQEEDETNNSGLLATPLTVGRAPDLRAFDATVPPAIVAGSGDELAVSVSVANNGAATAAASEIGFFLSLDRTIDSTDPFLGRTRVPLLVPSASRRVDERFLIPGSFPPGSYFLIARADLSNTVAETDETPASNDAVSNATVSVLATAGNRPRVLSLAVSRPDPFAVPAGVIELVATYDRSLREGPTIAIDQPGTNDLPPVPMNGAGTVWRFQYRVPEDNGTFNRDGIHIATLEGGRDLLAIRAETFTTASAFISDTIPPVVRVSFPAEGSIVSPVFLVSGTVSDASGSARVSVALEGASAADATVSGGTFERQVALAGERGTVIVRASDRAGNTSGEVRRTVTVDSDGDGMPDFWERQFGLDPSSPTDSSGDADADGLTNVQEFRSGTRPDLADTDGDGTGDGVEVAQGTDPVNGSNRAPVASAREGAGSLPGSGPRVVSLDGTGSSDPDGHPLSFAWSQVSGPEVTIDGPASALPGAVLRETGTYRFRLVVSDGRVQSPPAEVAVTVSNVAPAAHAGADSTVRAREAVRLDGTRSTDPNRDPLTYAWTESALNPILGLLGDPTAPDPQVTPPVAGNYDFLLRVTDPGGLRSDSSRVTLRVMDPAGNVLAPRADAGLDQTVDAGTLVALDGHESVDPDAPSLPLVYRWAAIAGPPGLARVVLAGDTGPSPTFTPAAPGVYTFQLVVVDRLDDGLESEPATVRVRVNSAGSFLPLAAAGPDQEISLGAVVLLDGRGSGNRSGSALAYGWRQSGGPPADILSGDRAIATVRPILPGTYDFELVVSDGAVNSEPDTVRIQVAGATDGRAPAARVRLASPPSLGAGEDRVRIPESGGLTVVLDGSGSFDPEGAALAYRWRQTAGPPVVLSAVNLPGPSFQPLVSRVYSFELTVSDGSLEDFAVLDLVVDSPFNSVPRAVVTSATPEARTGSAIEIDGSASSDGDGTVLLYQWVQTGGVPVTPTNDRSARLGFVPPVDGLYTFQLFVDDGRDRSVPTEVAVLASASSPGSGATTPPASGGDSGSDSDSGSGGGGGAACAMAPPGAPGAGLSLALWLGAFLWLRPRRR